ncbi:MAG: MATE family efflux transporter [Lachnospiraceae bacterium]|nr:MATE family efflux transporter [Lachnospiraceae bacterium]
MKLKHHPQNKEVLLTGRPLPTLLMFALPIILGNIFQQLYNIVDAMVVGKYLGDLPLAGISIASPIMDILYALLLGASIGIGVLVGQLCGAEDWERLKRVHATALTGGGLVTLALSAVSLLAARSILVAQGHDPEVIAYAMTYLVIILSCLLFNYLYNYFAAVLRAWGNSRTPFYVLLVSSVLHALLDLLLCGVLQLGIRGVACSTVFCQILSTLWLALYTSKHCEPLRLKRGELRIDRREAGAILSFAWAAALQQAVVMVGRFLIQGMLTPLGTHSVTGYNMSMRVEQFLFCFSQGVSAAMVVGISLSKGKKDGDRERAFYYTAIRCEVILWAVLGAVLWLLAPRFIGLFSSHKEVIAAGTTYARTMALPYLFAFLGEVIQGFFRGIGRLRLTMIASVSQIVLRVILSALLIPLWNIPGICAAVTIGWILLVLIEGGYSLKVARRE